MDLLANYSRVDMDYLAFFNDPKENPYKNIIEIIKQALINFDTVKQTPHHATAQSQL
ncbi:hypothetical protein HDC92_000582 [Pedobacter sp. AK017]|nr:hypothetical protein [Pedobacter sp. AK017]